MYAPSRRNAAREKSIPAPSAPPVVTMAGNEVHAPGAIIRIMMRNFVTYTHAEFRCGPSLNMVLGPNGTGKSTLVCAICLGLGWPPSHLGRAKNISDFVKHGHSQSEIEIELKAGAAQKGRNPVIKRVMKRENNSSKWFINGQETSHTNVKTLMQSFGIQVDNLCQFLPQDKVADFAALSPVELLEQTQKAVGTSEMVEWHEALKKLSVDKRNLVNDKDNIGKTLAELQNRQNTQKAEVDRLQERTTLQTRHDALEKYVPILGFFLEQDKYNAAAQKKKDTKVALRQLHEELEPVLVELETKKDYRDQLEATLESKQKLVTRSRQDVENKSKNVDSHKTKIDDIQRSIKRINDEKNNRKQEILKRQKTITQLEGRRKNSPPDFDPREYNDRKRTKESRLRTVTEDIESVKRDTREIIDNFKAKKVRRMEIEKELESLQTKQGQQIGRLKNLSAETAKALRIIEENKSKFEHEVYGPPIITCSIKIPELATAVENVLFRNDQLAITVQSDRDNKMLQNLLFKQNGLTDISIRCITRKRQDFRPPVPDSVLRNYKFDTWLIDALDGPDAVLAMLCDGNKLHKIAATPRENNFEMEEIEKSPIESFVVGDKFYTIVRRLEYGAHATSTSTRLMNPKGIWTEAGGENQQLQRLNEEKTSLEQDMKEIHESHAPQKARIEALESESSQLKSEIKEIEDEKRELQKAKADWELLPTKIEEEQRKLDSLLDERKEEVEKIREKSIEIERLALQRADYALNFANSVSMIRKLIKDQLEVELLLAEAISDHKSLQDRHKDVTEKLGTLKREYEDAAALVAELKDVITQGVRKIAELKKACSEEEKFAHDQFEAKCRSEGHASGEARVQELESELNSLRQRLQLVAGGNPRIIKEYEDRAKQIEEIQQRVETVDGDIEALSEQIQTLREDWEPQLDEMIKKVSDAFSYNFEQIKCVGEVKVHKEEEDFSEWAIRILVKFRENENLSILTSQRQSGGERSVTTIFYLLALQSQAKSPFRVVDEINQGMDPRNERMVHERMVDIACAENTSQYFLITPKLLSGLKYHERMTVHTIYSGDAMPDNSKELEFNKLADLALRLAGTVN